MEPRKQCKENQTDLEREANRGKLPLQIQLEFRLGKGGGAWQKFLRGGGRLTWVPSPRPRSFPLVPTLCSPTLTRLVGFCVRHQKGLKKELRTPKSLDGGKVATIQWLFLYLFFNSSAREPNVSIPPFPSRQVAHSPSLPPPPPSLLGVSSRPSASSPASAGAGFPRAAE